MEEDSIRIFIQASHSRRGASFSGLSQIFHPPPPPPISSPNTITLIMIYDDSNDDKNDKLRKGWRRIASEYSYKHRIIGEERHFLERYFLERYFLERYFLERYFI